MADLHENLQKLRNISHNPKKQLDAYLSDGKQVIGAFPYYTPEVMADAAGIIPMGMWGAQTEFSLAKKYLVPFACPIMQACMELGLQGKYAGVKAVMIPTMCDTLRDVTQDFKTGVKDISTIAYTLPQNRKLAAAKEYLIEELTYVKEQIEKIYGVTITEEAMQKSIAVYNKHNSVMREFAAVANNHLDIITPAVRHSVFKSAWFMSKSEHIAAVEEIINQLKALPVYNFTGHRLILTGITAEPCSLLNILSDNNFAVVGDDVAQEMRQYRTDIPEDTSSLASLAQQWLNRSDPMAHDDHIDRVNLLEKLYKENNADAILVCLMKFCDPEEYEFVAYNSALKEAGIKVLSIDIDQQPNNYDQARTRIETLAELL